MAGRVELWKGRQRGVSSFAARGGKSLLELREMNVLLNQGCGRLRTERAMLEITSKVRRRWRKGRRRKKRLKKKEEVSSSANSSLDFLLVPLRFFEGSGGRWSGAFSLALSPFGWHFFYSGICLSSENNGQLLVGLHEGVYVLKLYVILGFMTDGNYIKVCLKIW